MNEPTLQAPGQAREAGLWDKAPAWRTLTVAASLLTLTAVALPVLLPEQDQKTAQPGSVHPAAMRVAVAPPPVTAVPPVEVAKANPPPQIPAAAIPAPATPAPQAILAPQAPVCAMRPGPTAPAPIGIGTVVGFEDRAAALAAIQLTQAQNGGKIDPDYIDNQRVFVRMGDGTSRAFILPRNLQVQIGDQVQLQNGYRNLALPCNYVPVQIASDLGPPPGSTVPQAPVSPPPGQAERTVALAAQPGAEARATEQASVCPITLSPQSQPMGGGVVIGYEGSAQAQQRMAANERQIGGPINPIFANTLRAIVRVDGSSAGDQAQVVVVPPGMTVSVGDHIAFNGVHRDTTIACGYAPPLVTADTGPAQPAAHAGQATAP